jgi:hypothetical protein
MHIPFNNLIKVQNLSIEECNAPWSIYINKSESWIPIQRKPHDTSSTRNIYACASCVNHIMSLSTPDDVAISPWGQALRKAD